MGRNGSHVLSLSFLSFGLKGGLAERKVGQVFLSLSLVMDGATMGGHGHLFFIKTRSLVGGGGGRFIGKSHVS
jgi:hypothetical protein